MIGHGHKKSYKEVILSNIEIDDNECWIWQGYKQKSGHGQLTFRHKSYFAHRFSYEIFNGKIEENKYVCHKCNNSSYVNPEHLYLGTQHDNMKDAVEAGTAIFNRTHSDEMVFKIRDLYNNGMKQTDIVNLFNINQSWVSRIVRFKKRKNIIGGD